MATPRRKAPPPLTDEPPMRFCPTLAAHLGLAGAVLLERIWELSHSERARRRPHAGRVFVFYPAKAMAQDFSFLSRRRLRRAVDRLRRDGLLARARAKGEARDAAAWYGVDKGAVDALGSLFPAPPPGHTPAAPPAAERRRDAR